MALRPRASRQQLKDLIESGFGTRRIGAVPCENRLSYGRFGMSKRFDYHQGRIRVGKPPCALYRFVNPSMALGWGATDEGSAPIDARGDDLVPIPTLPSRAPSPSTRPLLENHMGKQTVRRHFRGS